MQFISVFLFLFATKAIFSQHLMDTVPAHFPGGQGAWVRYAHKHFKVTETFSDEYNSASLVFKVSVKGRISDVLLIRGDTLLQKTFEDLLINSSPWKPATINGRPVPSTRTFFMNYHLEKE